MRSASRGTTRISPPMLLSVHIMMHKKTYFIVKRCPASRRRSALLVGAIILILLEWGCATPHPPSIPPHGPGWKLDAHGSTASQTHVDVRTSQAGTAYTTVTHQEFSGPRGSSAVPDSPVPSTVLKAGDSVTEHELNPGLTRSDVQHRAPPPAASNQHSDPLVAPDSSQGGAE